MESLTGTARELIKSLGPWQSFKLQNLKHSGVRKLKHTLNWQNYIIILYWPPDVPNTCLRGATCDDTPKSTWEFRSQRCCAHSVVPMSMSSSSWQPSGPSVVPGANILVAGGSAKPDLIQGPTDANLTLQEGLSYSSPDRNTGCPVQSRSLFWL